LKYYCKNFFGSAIEILKFLPHFEADVAPLDLKKFSGISGPELKNSAAQTKRKRKRNEGQISVEELTRTPVAKEPRFAWKIRLIESVFDSLFEILRLGCRLPSEFYGGLQQRILQLLIDLNKSPDLVPYSRSPRLRAKVYRLLRNFLLHENPKCATAMHAIVELVKVGLRDPAVEVAEESRECLDACRAAIYPKFPTLEIPPVFQAADPTKRSLNEPAATNDDPNLAADPTQRSFNEPAAANDDDDSDLAVDMPERPERSSADGSSAQISSRFAPAPPIAMQETPVTSAFPVSVDVSYQRPSDPVSSTEPKSKMSRTATKSRNELSSESSDDIQIISPPPSVQAPPPPPSVHAVEKRSSRTKSGGSSEDPEHIKMMLADFVE